MPLNLQLPTTAQKSESTSNPEIFNDQTPFGEVSHFACGTSRQMRTSCRTAGKSIWRPQGLCAMGIRARLWDSFQTEEYIE